MKQEARLLLRRARASLTLGVGHFNSLSDEGRTEAVLILLNHAAEMLLKAAIIQRGGSIWNARTGETHRFEKCVQIALNQGEVRFLRKEHETALNALNKVRDAAQHHIVSVSESQLYVHAQSVVIVFEDVLKDVFGLELRDWLPRRTLPLATAAQPDIITLFHVELDEIVKLLAPGRRKREEAMARLRPLAILNTVLLGDEETPSPRDLTKLGDALAKGTSAATLFESLKYIQADPTAAQSVAVHITRRDGIPFFQAPEGTSGAYPIVVKRVNELDRFSLSHTDLCEHLGLTSPKVTALVEVLHVKDDPELFRMFRFGGSAIGRYSQKALEALRKASAEEDLAEAWKQYRKNVKQRQSDRNKP